MKYTPIRSKEEFDELCYQIEHLDFVGNPVASDFLKIEVVGFMAFFMMRMDLTRVRLSFLVKQYNLTKLKQLHQIQYLIN